MRDLWARVSWHVWGRHHQEPSAYVEVTAIEHRGYALITSPVPAIVFALDAINPLGPSVILGGEVEIRVRNNGHRSVSVAGTIIALSKRGRTVVGMGSSSVGRRGDRALRASLPSDAIMTRLIIEVVKA